MVFVCYCASKSICADARLRIGSQKLYCMSFERCMQLTSTKNVGVRAIRHCCSLLIWKCTRMCQILWKMSVAHFENQIISSICRPPKCITSLYIIYAISRPVTRNPHTHTHTTKFNASCFSMHTDHGRLMLKIVQSFDRLLCDVCLVKQNVHMNMHA